MKVSELRGKSVADLNTLLAEKRTELVGNRRSLAAGELPNPQVVNTNRRDIARILTCLTEANQPKPSKGEDA
jgi:large subunit ribosomal protein L29